MKALEGKKITELVEHIGQSHANIHTEQAATHYLAKLATVLQGANAKLHYHGPTFPLVP